METIDLLKRAVTAFSRILKASGRVQAQARSELVMDLQRICSNCESAYSTVLARLSSVKDAYRADPTELAKALRAFAGDQETRDAFKPDHLCGEVDQLLTKLESNLDPLKYAIDVQKLRPLRSTLRDMGNVDAAIYQEYDEFARQLDQLGDDLESSPPSERSERVAYTKAVIKEFEVDLRDAIRAMRQAKDRVLR